MMKIFAETSLGTITGTGLGPIGDVSGLSGQGAMDKFTGAISSIIGFLTILAAIWFFFQFTIGGISWITAGGDKQKLTQARDKLTNAFVGLVIVVAGWAVLALAGQFFGWDILNPTVDVIKLK
jgi:hypothetical protein